MTSSRDQQSSKSGPSDRRMRGRKATQRVDPRIERSQGRTDKGTRRRAFLIGAVFLLIIGGIAGYGFYDKFVAPTRVLAARVGDTTFTQGDLVSRMRMMQASGEANGQPIDFGRAPFEVLLAMTEAGLMRKAAPRYNIQVTGVDVDAVLRQRFFPQLSEGEEAAPGQLEETYKQTYQQFLNRSHISDNSYRELVEEDVYRQKFREVLSKQVLSRANQVEVHWIRLSSIIDTLSTDASVEPSDIRKRLDTEDFSAVASELSVRAGFSNTSGYVGWVPKGAFRVLDEYLFGSDEQVPLAHNVINDPIFTAEGTYILKVTGGPEEREVSDVMIQRLNDRALENWLLEEKDVGAAEGWYLWNFNSDIYEWVVDQVREARPPDTPESGGQR